MHLRFLQTLTEVSTEKKLNNDHPFPDRLTQSLLSEEGEGITEVLLVSRKEGERKCKKKEDYLISANSKKCSNHITKAKF